MLKAEPELHELDNKRTSQPEIKRLDQKAGEGRLRWAYERYRLKPTFVEIMKANQSSELVQLRLLLETVMAVAFPFDPQSLQNDAPPI